MRGLDANVLIRHITQDDPVQSPKATRIIQRQLTVEDPGFVSLGTMLETAWVLRTIYGLTNPALARTLQTVLQVETIVVQNEAEVYTATSAVKSGAGSFEDALIGALGLWAGCTSTLTFDRKASHLPGFELIP